MTNYRARELDNDEDTHPNSADHEESGLVLDMLTSSY